MTIIIVYSIIKSSAEIQMCFLWSDMLYGKGKNDF